MKQLETLYDEIGERIKTIQKNELDRSVDELAGRVSELTLVQVRIQQFLLELL